MKIEVATSKPIVLGSEWFDKASAVEGIFLSSDEKTFFASLSASTFTQAEKLQKVRDFVASKV